MDKVIEFVLLCVGLLYCFHGMHGVGFRSGLEEGYMSAIRDLKDGSLKVDGRKLLFDGATLLICDGESGEPIREIDLDKLDIMEV